MKSEEWRSRMSDSEGSDIDVEGGEFDQGIDGEEAGDPLDRAQVEVNADCGDGWLAAMFGDDDDDDSRLLGISQ